MVVCRACANVNTLGEEPRQPVAENQALTVPPQEGARVYRGNMISVSIHTAFSCHWAHEAQVNYMKNGISWTSS